MTKFPTDTPKGRVIKALQMLGFSVVREAEHIALVRENLDGTRTPMTIPNHRRIKGSTLRSILMQAKIPREEFMKAWEKA